MPKMCSEPMRHALSGPTMGTRWSVICHTGRGFDTAPLRTALQGAVDRVDAQMSAWKRDSDLMRLNATPAGRWVKMPAEMMRVLRLALEIGRASDGAFDVGLGDAVGAWGFGPEAADHGRIRAALNTPRRSAHEVLELDGSGGQVRKHAPLTLDLNGVAKGFGVDRLAEVMAEFGVEAGLISVDGELRALGLQPDGRPWNIAVEAPDPDRRAPHAVLALEDAAVATSGDYRHWVQIGTRRLSHTMDPARGAPLMAPPASVSVVARTCAKADAWATALMVMGEERGTELAETLGLNALFLLRGPEGVRARGTGRLFEGCSALKPA